MENRIQIFNNSSRFFSNSQKAFTLENKNRFGERKDSQISYSVFEVVYLLETNQAELIRKNKKIQKNLAIKSLLRNKEDYSSYLVFKDLRKKGLIPKTGLKFGAEFRVYEKKKTHATFLTLISNSNQNISWKEFIARNRIAHSTGKKVLIALIDSQQDITYYSSDWVKLKHYN